MLNYVFAEKNTGNDATAIQTAINDCVRNGTLTAVIKGGVWSVSETLYLYDNVRVIIDDAKLFWRGKKGGVMFTNVNSPTSYGYTIAAEQKGITVFGDNGASLAGAGVLFRNVRELRIENLIFEGSEFGAAITSSIGVRLKNLRFIDCEKGVAFGCGASDCFAVGVSGEKVKTLFDIDGGLFPDMFKMYHPETAKNIIIRGVNASAVTFFRIGGESEKIMLNDVCGTAENCVVDFVSGKHVSVKNVTATGKLVCGTINKEQFIIE